MMEALFLKLVSMSIAASWLVLAVVVLRLAMKKAPKWMTCALWVMVALRLILPFSLESNFSLIPKDISSGQVVENITDTYWGDTKILQENTAGYQAAVDAGREPVSIGNGHYYVVTAPDGISEPPTVENAVIPVLSNIWLIGAAALLIYAAVSYLLIRRKVAASLHLRDHIYLCDYIESPFILGILRPRIYLPSSLDQSQWPHVLAHEQAHLHRKDHWWKPLGFALLCVYWFNPVLWLAYILLCRDIELACDERVIRDMDTRQKQDYTTALLECSMPRYLVAACPLAFGEVGVKERVKSVLNYKKPAFWIILIALVLCGAAAVCFMTDPMMDYPIVPGTYTLVEGYSIQHKPGAPSIHSMPARYTLQDNTLYANDGQGPVVLGTMIPYDLSMDELKGYIPENQWNRFDFHRFASISDALWLRLENDTFIVLFTTSRGETYLAYGVEDIGERYQGASDDTYLAYLDRATKVETAEEKELAWFDAIVTDSQTTWLMVSPIDNAWMSSQYTQISVSRYWHASENGAAATGILPGEFTVGDRVRIVYDGNIAESSPAQINKTYSITKQYGPATAYTAISGENRISPLLVPVNTDVSALSNLPFLTLKSNENGQYQFQLLRDGSPNPGYFRLYDYSTKEEIKNFHTFGSTTGPDWSLLKPGRNYIVVQERDGILCFIASVPYDFGITLTGSNITPTGMTVTCTQSGGNCPGVINYGNPQGYWLRRMTDDGWENVPNLDGSTGVTITTEVYVLERNSTLTWNYNWANRFGTLEPGHYRFDMYFSSGEPLENYTYLPVSVYFTIGDSSLQSHFPDYFGLSTFKGLELYAFDDGYVLMSGTNREKTEDEINALPRASEEEMKMILESYRDQIEYQNIFIDNRTIRTERDIRIKLGIAPFVEASLNIIDATSTEGLLEYQFTIPGICEVWTGYNYDLEVLTDDGWIHYGYPREELAWPAALLFHQINTDSESISVTEVFDVQWSTTTGGPLPSGTYRYCQPVTIYYDGDDLQFQNLYAIFHIPEDTPEDPGIHMEILNPTDTGATLAITYKGGLMGELTTQGQYYLMVETDGGYTNYGKVPSLAAWDDVLYTLKEGETVYIDVRWDHTADAPLPQGIYCVVLTVNQTVPYMETQQYPITKQVTGTFAIID